MSKWFGKASVTITLTALIMGTAQFCWAADGSGLKDYVDLALQKSPNMRLAQLSFERNKLSQTDNLIKGSVLSLKQAEVANNSAQRALAAAERDLRLSVQTGYYNLLKAQKGLEIASQSSDQAKEQLEMVKVRFQQGVASKLDLISAEKQAKNAEINLMTAQSSLETARASFKRVVGISDDITLAEELASPAIEITKEEALTLAQSSSPDVASAKENLELAQLQYDLAQNNFTAENQKKLTAVALEETKINLNERQADVASTVNDLYVGLVASVNSIDMANKTMEYAEENYRVMKLRYDAGLEIASALIDAQMSLVSAKIEALNASSNYNVAKTRFMNYIGK